MKFKALLVALLILLLPAGLEAQAADKALMLTVFGTSTEASVTFDELLPLVEKQFPDRDVVVPYTSGVIRNKLNAAISDPAMKILSPGEMLARLRQQGYKDIAVVSTILFDGVEHDKLKATVDEFAAQNPGIKVSYTPPLLADDATLRPVVRTIGKHIIKNGQNIVVSHGTHDGHPVEKTYMRIAALVAEMYPNARLGSIEGVPDVARALDWVEKKDGNDVRFVVFMFVAGDHAENDIASDEEDSLFSAVREMGKTPSVAWAQTGSGKMIASLGLDPEYRRILLDYFARNVGK